MHTLLIRNPAAGSPQRRQDLPDAISLLVEGGWRVDWAATQGPGDAEHLAATAAENGYDQVLVAGGDGTIHAVANGLMAARQAGQPAVKLAILPAGTANVLARDLDLAPPSGPVGRHTLVDAARRLLRSAPVWIDLGRVTAAHGQRYFACWAGVGLDAAVSAAVESQPKFRRQLKPALFAVNALRELGRAETVARYHIVVDDAPWSGEAILAVVSNIRHYALVLQMAPQAYLNDGLLDSVVFQGSTIEAAVPLIKLLAGAHVQDTAVGYAQARRITIETERPRPVHLDAEPFGTTPIAIEVAPQALPVLMPPTAVARCLVPIASHPVQVDDHLHR